MRVAFYSNGPIEQISGGYIYNRKVIEYLRRAGVDVRYHADPAALATASSDAIAVIDSLVVAQNLPHIRRLPRPPVLLLHVAIAELERQLPPARVVATSADTRRRVDRSAGSTNIAVIEPGVAPDWPQKAAYAKSARKLLCLANYVPGKGHELLLAALQRTQTTSWTLRMHGNRELDPACHSSVLRQAEGKGLRDRVRVAGPVPHEEVAQLMCESDLLLQLSEHESYSIVTAEAIACGLPVLATKTGNWPQFAKSGLLRFVQRREAGEVAGLLDELMTSEASYARLRPLAAGAARSWDQVGREFLEVLRQHA